MQKRLIKLLKQQPCSLEYLASFLKLPDTDILNNINLLDKKGITIEDNEGKYHIPSTEYKYNTHVYSNMSTTPSKVTYIATSDWHIGSKQHDKSGLEYCMKKAIDEGAQFALHSGDIVDGFNVYHGHMNNLLVWTVEEQTDLAAKTIDKFPIEIYGIGGNHDHSYTQQNGIRPTKLIEMKNSNFHDLGDFYADFLVDGCDIRLLHGAGGNSYSQSYPAQRYMRNLAEGNPESVPDILQIGHFHTNPVFEIYGCLIMHPSNFQGQNDFMIRRGLRGVRGLYLVTLDIEQGNIMSYNTKFIKAKE